MDKCQGPPHFGKMDEITIFRNICCIRETFSDVSYSQLRIRLKSAVKILIELSLYTFLDKKYLCFRIEHCVSFPIGVPTYHNVRAPTILVGPWLGGLQINSTLCFTEYLPSKRVFPSSASTLPISWKLRLVFGTLNPTVHSATHPPSK